MQTELTKHVEIRIKASVSLGSLSGNKKVLCEVTDTKVTNKVNESVGHLVMTLTLHKQDVLRS